MPTITAATKFTLKQVQSILPAKQGDKYLCPACEQWHLAINEKDGKVLVHCKTPDCSPDAAWKSITEKLGRVKAPKSYVPPSGPGLTITQYAEAKKLPADWLAKFWGFDEKYQGIPAVAFPYLHDTGEKWSAIEFTDPDAGAAMDGLPVVKGFGDIKYRYGMGKDERRFNKGAKSSLYGHWQLQCALSEVEEQPGFCFIVEGESDTQTLAYNGCPVLGVSGTEGWKHEYSEDSLLKGKMIFVIQEPNESAARFAQKVANSFPPGDVYSVRLLVKDVSDLWIAQLDACGEWEEVAQEAFAQSLISALKTATVVLPEGDKANAANSHWELDTITADKIKPLAWRWLWKERVPLGCLTIFFGMAGAGKSTVAIDLVYRLSKGLDLPDRKTTVSPCDTMLFIREDDLAKTVKPRLMAAGNQGADFPRVHIVKGSKIGTGASQQTLRIALDTDLEMLERELKKWPDVRLLIIDPISSYLGKKDQNKGKEVRPLLEDMQALAERCNISVIGIMHFNKNMDQAAIHRISGASAWGEVPRALWAFVHAPKSEDSEKAPANTYLMLNAKLNLIGEFQRSGIKYETKGKAWIEDGEEIETSWINWLGSAEINLDDVLKDELKRPGPKPEKTEAAMVWLREELADAPQHAKDMQSQGEAAGFSKDLLDKAKRKLGVKSRQTAYGWFWELP